LSGCTLKSRAECGSSENFYRALNIKTLLKDGLRELQTEKGEKARVAQQTKTGQKAWRQT
jgi:hypothetical protein